MIAAEKLWQKKFSDCCGTNLAMATEQNVFSDCDNKFSDCSRTNLAIVAEQI